MAKEKPVQPNVRPILPIVWFLGDGYFSQVWRDFLDDNNRMRVLVVKPEKRIRLRYPDLDLEARKSGGFLKLSFHKEFVMSLNPDPASPRMLVLTDVKGEVQDIIHKHLMETVLSQKQQIESLIIRHIKKDLENKGLVEDFEGKMDMYKRIKNAIGAKEQDDKGVKPEDYGGS